MPAPPPVCTTTPLYAERPLPRNRPTAWMALGTALLVTGTVALLGAPLRPTALHVSLPRALTTHAPATFTASALRAAEDDGLTVGDLLRGGSPGQKGAGLGLAPGSKIVEQLRQDVVGGPEPAKPEPVVDVAMAASQWRAAQGLVVDEEKSITRISFGTIGIVSGVSLLAYGFGAYFQLLPGEAFSAVMLIYGFPASLIGFALKYAELQPLECRSTAEGLALRAAQATDIQTQLREDVTRFRYGDEKHLEEAISRVFQVGRPDGIPRNAAPKLVGIQEQAVDGRYALILEFENNPRVPLSQWTNRREKMQAFFGPGIRVELGKTEVGVDVALICDGSGLGRGGQGQSEVLPPLMPGLQPRRQG